MNSPSTWQKYHHSDSSNPRRCNAPSGIQTCCDPIFREMPTSLASRVTRPHAGIISVFVVVVAAADVVIYIEGGLGGVGG
jgi:hypothetical protein